MESQYIKDVQIPTLEQKKKKLEEIRNFYKQPLDTKDIFEHQIKYEKEAEKRQKEREKKRRLILNDFYERDQEIKSARIIEIESLVKEEEEEKKRERKQINERMLDYFNSIKDNIMAKSVSIKKTRSEAQLHQNVSVDMREKSKILSASKDAYYELRTEVTSQKRGITTSRHSQNVSLLSKNVEHKNIQWKSEYTKIEESKKEKEWQKEMTKKSVLELDYLKQMIRERDENIKSNKLKKVDDKDWNKFIWDNQLTDREKYDMVKVKAKQLEDQAKLDEQLLIIDDNDPIAVEKAIEVNDLYIKSIQAKLALLNTD